MDDLEKRIDRFNGVSILSPEFEALFVKMTPIINKENNGFFIKRGETVTKSWKLCSGFVVVIYTDSKDNRIVTEIYTPGQVFTDLDSFFNELPSQYDYMAVGRVVAYELTRSDFNELLKYGETYKMLNNIHLTNEIKDRIKERLQLMPVKERVVHFFRGYDVEGLPDEHCASLLRMPLEEYQKLDFTAIKVKLYLKKNYCRDDVENTVELSSKFNTNRKTLTKKFKLTYGISIYEMILKLKMERAQKLLKEEKISAKAVGEKLGYKDVYYFSKVFKKYFGYSIKEVMYKNLSSCYLMLFSKIVTLDVFF